MRKPSSTEYIDVHTHSLRETGFFIMNVFAQELEKGLPAEVPCTIGLHPWHLEETDIPMCFQLIDEFALFSQVIALGESGIDRNINTSLKIQEEIFMEHIQISEKVHKPLIIHCVKAYSDILRIRKMKTWKMPWMFHWFNSNLQIANDLIESGCYLSFGRSLLHPNGKNAEVFCNVPLDWIFFETDDAQITIEEVYLKATDLKKIPIEELIRKVFENYLRFFCAG